MLPKVIAGIVAGVAIAVAAVWYIGIYDTAAARCERGDLDACTVLRQRADAAVAADQAQRAAEWQARVDEAIFLEEERGEAGRCEIRLDGARTALRVSGPGAAALCGGWHGTSAGTNGGAGLWEFGSLGSEAEWVCAIPYGGEDGAELTISVFDDGSRTTSDALCSAFLAGAN